MKFFLLIFLVTNSVLTLAAENQKIIYNLKVSSSRNSGEAKEFILTKTVKEFDESIQSWKVEIVYSGPVAQTSIMYVPDESLYSNQNYERCLKMENTTQESLTVPAGTFLTCKSGVRTPNGIGTMWFAKDIPFGYVRSEIGGSYTIRIEELAEIKN